MKTESRYTPTLYMLFLNYICVKADGKQKKTSYKAELCK